MSIYWFYGALLLYMLHHWFIVTSCTKTAFKDYPPHQTCPFDVFNLRHFSQTKIILTSYKMCSVALYIRNQDNLRKESGIKTAGVSTPINQESKQLVWAHPLTIGKHEVSKCMYKPHLKAAACTNFVSHLRCVSNLHQSPLFLAIFITGIILYNFMYDIQ